MNVSLKVVLRKDNEMMDPVYQGPNERHECKALCQVWGVITTVLAHISLPRMLCQNNRTRSVLYGTIEVSMMSTFILNCPWSKF